MVLLLSQGHPGVLLAQARTLMTFINDPTFYRVITASSTYPRRVQSFQSTQSSRNRLPPYRSVKSENETKSRKRSICIVISRPTWIRTRVCSVAGVRHTNVPSRPDLRISFFFPFYDGKRWKR